MEQLSIDSRIPVTVSKRRNRGETGAAAAKYGLEYKEFDWLAPIYLPLDHFMVRL